MARRGKFGRRPRSSPDLSATIVAMAREYQNMRDRNILNAWEKGGKFEGQAVTDDMLLDHLRMRRDGLSPDDALYDEYGQRLTEYTFAVDNSKMELKYAQGKVGDAGMAGFYRKAATKLPKDSEAWRNMMKLAAQYKDRANSGGGGGGGGRGGGRGGGYNSAANRQPGKKGFAYDEMINALTEVARAEGILNTKKETLGDLRVAEGDASRMVHLMEVFNTDPKYKEYKDYIVDRIRTYGNENFGGDITWDSIQAEKTNKDNDTTSRLRKAQAAGHGTDVKAILKEMGETDTLFLQATAAYPLAAYEAARGRYDKATDDPNMTALGAFIAAETYRNDLTDIHASTVSQYNLLADPDTATLVGHLNNEIMSLSGGDVDVNAPTLWEDSRGTVAAYHKEGGEAANNVDMYQHMVAEVKQLVSGKGVIARVDAKGQVTADNTAGYGVVPVEAVTGGPAAWVGATGALPSSIELEGQTVDISHVMTAVLPVPINVVGVGGDAKNIDRQGRSTTSADAKSNPNVANQFTMPDGTELVQYWDAAGTIRWTSDAKGLFAGPNGETLAQENMPDGSIQVSLPVLGSRDEYDPNTAFAAQFDKPQDAIDAMYNNPALADTMVTKVSLSSYSAWLGATRTDESDPGVAYAMDPKVMAEAIMREVGTDKPAVLGAALRQAEVARTDYLKKTPDVDIRIRQAAQLNLQPTLADSLGMPPSDLTGLRRDVEGFYARLQTTGKEEDDLFLTPQNTERDKVIRKALEEDTAEAYRIAGFEHPLNMAQNFTRDFTVDAKRRRDVALVGAGTGQPASTVTFKQNEVVGALRGLVGGGITNAVGVVVGGLAGPKPPTGNGVYGPGFGADTGLGGGAPTPKAPPPKTPPYNPYKDITPNGPQPYGGKPPPPPKPFNPPKHKYIPGGPGPQI